MKKWRCVISICALSIIVFTGCSLEGFGQASPSSDIPFEEANAAKGSLSQEETELMEYERKYFSGEFTTEDYQAIAALYAKQGKIRKQRDMLEQSYRLFEDNEAFKLLQDISVNLEEEEAAVREQAMLLYQNLAISEYKQEAIHVIENKEWFDILMPKLGEGVRKYFLQENGRTTLLICVGYDENGKNFSNAWYLGDGDKLTLLSYSDGVIQLLETSLKEDKYEGDFTLWVLDSTSGSILNEQGTFTKGVYSGEYTLNIHKNDVAGDPFDLWNNRENMEYTSYTVKADEQGQGDLEQFAAKLMSYPVINTYEVKADEENDSEEVISQPDAVNYQVRVFDGDIQLFQNGIWVNVGSVEQYVQNDPFRVYVKQNTQNGNEQLWENEGIDFDHLKIPDSVTEKDKNKDNTTVQKPTTQKPATQKPAAQKPATQAPTVTTPPASPTPAPNVPDDDDDDGGSSDSGSAGGSSSDSGSSSDNGGDSDNSGSDNGGGDDGGGTETDVEWTPDLM